MANINEAYSKIDQHFKAGGKAPAADSSASGAGRAGYGPGRTSGGYYNMGNQGQSPDYAAGGAGFYDGTYATQGDETEFFQGGFMDPDQVRAMNGFGRGYSTAGGMGGPSGFEEYTYMDPQDQQRWDQYFRNPPSSGFGGGNAFTHEDAEEQEAAEAWFRAMNHGYSNDYHKAHRRKGPRTVSRNAGAAKKQKQQEQKQRKDNQKASSKQQAENRQASPNNAGTSGNNNANASGGANGDDASNGFSSKKEFRKWSDSERNALANMYSEGKSFEFIANALGRERAEVLDEYNNVLHMANATGKPKSHNNKKTTSGSGGDKKFKGFSYVGTEGDGDFAEEDFSDFSEYEFVPGPDGQVFRTPGHMGGPRAYRGGIPGGGRGRGAGGMSYRVDLNGGDFTEEDIEDDDDDDDDGFLRPGEEFVDLDDIYEEGGSMHYHRPGTHSMHGGSAGQGKSTRQGGQQGNGKGGGFKPKNKNKFFSSKKYFQKKKHNKNRR